MNTGKMFGVILTGATGMVGEGVLLECLANPAVGQVLVVGRRSCGRTHAKMRELVVSDFIHLDGIKHELAGYDACFYCAGISSRGLSEAEYTHITCDTVIRFAEVLARLNPEMIFGHISGSHADSSEQGRVMWARVKGRAENALMKMSFRKVYNFRPGFMKPAEGQRNIKGYYKAIAALYPVLRMVFPAYVSTMQQVGLAMIHSVVQGYPKTILEIKDINTLAEKSPR